MNEALWTLLGVLVGAIASGAVNIRLQNRQFSHEKEMYSLKNQAVENVKALLEEMLNHKSYTDRSFEAIRRRVGGYSDNEVRQLLHEIGAKKTTREDSEWWYLASREEERIEKRKQRA